MNFIILVVGATMMQFGTSEVSHRISLLHSVTLSIRFDLFVRR